MQFKLIGEILKTDGSINQLQKLGNSVGDINKFVSALKKVSGIKDNVKAAALAGMDAADGVVGISNALNMLNADKPTLSIGKLTTSVKGLWTVAKGAFTTLASNPLTWVVGAAIAVGALVKHLADVHVSAEEANEKMNNSFSAYESAKSEVEAINTELETTGQPPLPRILLHETEKGTCPTASTLQIYSLNSNV